MPTWVTQKTWQTEVVTDPDLNTYIRDNMNVLKTSITDDGHFKYPTIQSKTGVYGAVNTDDVILCNGTFTVTLYATTGNVGRILQIKNIGTGVITIDGLDSDTIDGALTQEISQQYASLTLLVGAVATWYIL